MSAWLPRLGASLRRPGAGDSGASITELLVGAAIGVLIMTGITSAIFTTNQLRLRADDENRIAGALAVVSLDLDRDAAMATATAPAKSQTSATSCATTMDLGFLEGGASVRFRTIAAVGEGPFWLQRVSGAGTITVARNVASCTWQVVRDTGGDWTIRLDLTITGPNGETSTQVLRAQPRLW